MTALPKSKGRATLSRTLFVCGLLLAALAIVFLIASVIGSQRLPFAASLCALTGRSNCGLSPEQQAQLQQLYEQTNPFQLREAIYRQLEALWEMASAQSSNAA